MSFSGLGSYASSSKLPTTASLAKSGAGNPFTKTASSRNINTHRNLKNL